MHGYGAAIGDIVGSRYEFDNVKRKDFEMFGRESRFTDDTVMTVAVARAVLDCLEGRAGFREALVARMREYGRRYPDCGYGGRFARWVACDDPQPYRSWGNGAAMRVSPCGIVAVNLNEARELAAASAAVTHDHPEGVAGAQAAASAVFLAKRGAGKDAIRRYIRSTYHPLDFTIDEIRDGFTFDVSCRGTVPQAIEVFLEADGFEDTVRTAVSLGGDSDTLAAIAGSIAWEYELEACGGSMDVLEVREPGALRMLRRAQGLMPRDFIEVLEGLDDAAVRREREFSDAGTIAGIL